MNYALKEQMEFDKARMREEDEDRRFNNPYLNGEEGSASRIPKIGAVQHKR